MWIIHRLASFKLEKHRLLTNLGFFFLVMCLSFKLFKIFLMVKLLTLENQILHQIQYFFVVFLVSAPIINAMQIHVTSHCYTTNRLAWLASLLLHLKKKSWSIYDSDQTGLSSVNTHLQKQSQFHILVKTFVKNSTVTVCCVNVYLGTLL